MTDSDMFNATLQDGLYTSAAFSLLVLLVLMIRRPVAKRFGANAAYLLWLVPVSRLALPALPAKFTALGWLPPFGNSLEAVNAPAALENPRLIFEPASPPLSASAGPGDTLLFVPEAPIAADQMATQTGFWPSMSGLSGYDWLLIVGLVWGLGALIYLGRNIYRQYEFARLIDLESTDPSPSVSETSDRARTNVGVRRSVAVRTSFLTSGPLVTGFLRPTILLPAWFEEDYTPAEQEAALMHEMMHIKRGDLWSLQIALFVMALQWFNPLAHIAVGRFRADQEAACDQDVLKHGRSSPRTYGETLVKTVAIANSSRHGALAASLTLNHAIKERLILMQNPTPTLRNRLLGSAMILALGACAMAATAQVSQSADQELSGSDDQSVEFHFEHDNDGEHRDIHISDDSVFVMKTSGDGHALVILGNPFEDLHMLQPEIDELVSQSMTLVFDTDFSDLDILADLSDLSDLEGLDVLSDNETVIRILDSDLIGELDLEELGILLDADGDGGLSINFDTAQFNLAEFEEKMEVFEERMEVFEAQIEARTEQVEELAEAFTEKYEHRFEATGDAIESISERCEEYTFLSNEPFVILQETAGDETLSAVCAADGFSSLQSDEGKEFVMFSEQLSAEEKEKYLSKIDTIEFSEDGNSFSFDHDIEFDFDSED